MRSVVGEGARGGLQLNPQVCKYPRCPDLKGTAIFTKGPGWQVWCLDLKGVHIFFFADFSSLCVLSNLLFSIPMHPLYKCLTSNLVYFHATLRICLPGAAQSVLSTRDTCSSCIIRAICFNLLVLQPGSF